jgi:hypothetical protein
MILSELLGLPVLDPTGENVGTIVDVRFVIDGPPDQLLAAAQLYGFIVGRHAKHSFMGYERTSETAPAVIARFLRWRERGSFLILWKDVERVTKTGLLLRPDYGRYSPAFDT